MYSGKKILFFIVSLACFQAQALSPLQYCERLHARRPAGSTTSSEVLNVNTVSSTEGADQDGKYINMVKQTKYCKNGVFKYRVQSIRTYFMKRIGGGEPATYTNCQFSNVTCDDFGGNCYGGEWTCPATVSFCVEGPGCTNQTTVADPGI